MPRYCTVLACAWLLVSAFSVHSAESGLPTFTDGKAAGRDFATQGEYVGEITADGQQKKIGVQVIALGDDKLRAVRYNGGLPGDGWRKGDKHREVDGKNEGSIAVFKGETHEARIKDGVLTVLDPSGKEVGKLKKIERKSPTLGAKPNPIIDNRNGMSATIGVA